MIESFHIAATGMHTQQTNVDVIANNLANVNTSSFKKSQVNFEDLMYRPAIATSAARLTPDTMNPIGIGSTVASVNKVFSQGQLKSTGRSLDIALDGKGFLEIILPDGSYAYTRAGGLEVNEDGLLVNPDGFELSPGIQVPTDADNLLIDADGRVAAQLAGEQSLTEIGRIQLADFINPAGLTPIGDNLLLPSQASGEAFHSEPGQDGMAVLRQGFLESSNVNLVEELTNLILAQRAYEMNSRVVQVADELLGIVNQLRR